MNKIAVTVFSLLLFFAGSALAGPVSAKLDELNRTAVKITVEKSNRRVTELFNQALDVPFYNSVCSETDILRDEAFNKDDFTKIDLFCSNALPVYRIVIGGEANFVGPNVEFFLSKCAPNTVEHQFFELAMTGWIDLNTEMHGGKENFPAWIHQTDGISGTYIKEAGADALRKWKELLPKLSGNYKKIAQNTVKYIEDMRK